MDIKIKSPQNLVLKIILFCPTFFGYLSLGTGQMIYLLIVLSYVLFLYLYFYKRKSETNVLPIISIFIIQSFCYSLTLIYNVIYGNVTIRDYFEPCRPIIYMAFFLCPIILNEKKYNVVTKLRKYMLVTTFFDIIKFIPALFPLMCFYTPFGFSSTNYIRFSGTFGFCYNYGFIMIFLLLYSFLYKRENNKMERLLYLIIIFICIFLTGSRSIYAAFSFAVGLYLLFYVKGVIKKIKYLILTILLLTLIYISLKDIDNPIIESTLLYVENLIEALFYNGKDGSLSTRQSQLDLALEYFSQNYLLGAGSMKGSSDPIEMLFGYYISSWGILGTTIFIIQILVFCRISYIMSKKTLISFEENIFSKANFLWICTIPIVGMSTPITEQVRVFNIFYILQGIQYIIYIKYKNERYYKKDYFKIESNK